MEKEPRSGKTKCSSQGFRPPRLIGPLCQYLAQSPCYYIQYASHCLPSAYTNTPPSTAGPRGPKKLCQIICWLGLPPAILSANRLNDLFRVVFLKPFVALYRCKKTLLIREFFIMWNCWERVEDVSSYNPPKRFYYNIEGALYKQPRLFIVYWF